jgi:hypothetical protein
MKIRMILLICIVFLNSCEEEIVLDPPTKFAEGQFVKSKLDGKTGLIVQIGDGTRGVINPGMKYDYKVKFPKTNNVDDNDDSLYSYEWCRECELELEKND